MNIIDLKEQLIIHKRISNFQACSEQYFLPLFFVRWFVHKFDFTIIQFSKKTQLIHLLLYTLTTIYT